MPLRQPATLSVQEFAQWAGIGRTKTYEEINGGRLRALKIGRRTFIIIEDAQAWLSNQATYEVRGTRNGQA